MNPAVAERRLRQHVLAPTREFRAICAPGLEAIVASELHLLGIADPQCDLGGVDFQARYKDVCLLQARARTPARLLMRLGSFKCENFLQLGKGLAAIPFELYLPGQSTPAVEVTCRQSRLYHSDAVRERAERQLHDYLASWPPLASSAPAPIAQTIYLRLDNDRCTASIDLSGELLHKRGYDRYVEDAPIRENLAAALLLAANFSQAKMLYDPMAGSGTYSLEAAQWLHGPEPGDLRPFACQSQPAFAEAAYRHGWAHRSPLFTQGPTLQCSDRDAKALRTIAHNASASGTSAWIQATAQDFFALPPAPPGTLLALNPPYGKRIQANALSLYKEIGKKIRCDFSNSCYTIIAPTPECRRALALQPDFTLEFRNGGLPVYALTKKIPAA